MYIRREMAALFASASGLAAQNPDIGKSITLAILNRERRWKDLESMARLEKSFRIDTPIGKSPTIYQMRY
jgi:hypothetical protein